MERYFYIPFGSGNLAKPVKVLEEAKAAAEAWAKAQEQALMMAEPKEMTVVEETVEEALEEEPDLEALLAGLGLA